MRVVNFPKQRIYRRSIFSQAKKYQPAIFGTGSTSWLGWDLAWLQKCKQHSGVGGQQSWGHGDSCLGLRVWLGHERYLEAGGPRTVGKGDLLMEVDGRTAVLGNLHRMMGHGWLLGCVTSSTMEEGMILQGMD